MLDDLRERRRYAIHEENLGEGLMTDYAIRTANLTSDFETVRSVDHLALEVPKGTIFGFLGPNGAGKTTTTRLLLGLLEPTEGRAEVLGFDTQTQADEIRCRTGHCLSTLVMIRAVVIILFFKPFTLSTNTKHTFESENGGVANLQAEKSSVGVS